MPLPLFGTVVECDLPCQPETVSSDRPDALNAAFLSAVSAKVLECDDTHLGTVIHPTAPVAPGLFALAGLRPVSGRELLHAFILGVEISCRVGLGVMPTQWVLSPTIGFHDEVGVKLVEHLAGIGERRKALIELHRALERLSDGLQHPISNLHSYTACSRFDCDPHARSAPALHDPDPAVTKHRDHAFERPAERFGRSGKARYPGRFAG
jgi:hypothetical protein